AIKLRLASVTYCIISIYRSPVGKLPYFISTLDLVLNKLYSISTNIILCGDVNINYLCESNNRTQLDSLLASYNLFNIVNFPTRIDNKSSTAIDGIFIDKYKFFNYVIMPGVNGLSDHDAQVLVLNNSKVHNSKFCRYNKRQINKTSIENFKLNLSFETWEEIFSNEDVDKIFNAFLNIYLRNFNNCFPIKKLFSKYNNKAWLTAGIRISCQHKRNLYILSRNSNNPILYAYYKKYCGILREVIKTAKKMHYNRLIAKSNNKTKTMWSMVNNVTGKCKNIRDPPPLIVEGMECKDSQSIATAFNLYFDATTIKKLNNVSINLDPISSNDNFRHYLSSLPLGPSNNILYEPVTYKELSDIIKSLKNKSSYGYDEISTKIIKLSMLYIMSPLIYICNRSLATGTFPSRLKYSQIHPVHKKGDASEVSNYRPISVLTSFSKIFEKVIYNRVYAHVVLNNILPAEQHGFRKHLSTDTAILSLLNNIMQALNDRKLVGGIFCDLTKAFDSVNHDILLEKMDFYGIRGIFHKLLTSYLSDRYQRVVIKDKQAIQYFSEWKQIRLGVPQGSILGPLFFLLYINDLPAAVNNMSKPILFADDISLIVSTSDPNQLKECFNLVVEKLMRWFQANSLTLNFNKTYCMYFTTIRKHIVNSPIKYLHSDINSTQVMDFLGVSLDPSLSWQGHISKTIKKLNSACFAIRSLKSLLSINDLKMIYFAYAHSIIVYGIAFWGNATNSKDVFIVQKRIIRSIMNVNSRASCRGFFKYLNILPFYSQYILSLLLLVVKNMHLFALNAEIHVINTRQSTSLHVPLINLAKYKNSVCCMGIKIFNNLPHNLRKLSSDYKKFKLAINNFLLNQSFYSINEYLEWSKERK
ncbi:hypothetical protein B7P43_G10907, partial [Cryptotermes secundus]